MAKPFKATSSLYEGSCRDMDENEEEEDLQRRLEEYESVLRRAENLRQLKLDESVSKLQYFNDKVVARQANKSHMVY